MNDKNSHNKINGNNNTVEDKSININNTKSKKEDKESITDPPESSKKEKIKCPICDYTEVELISESVQGGFVPIPIREIDCPICGVYKIPLNLYGMEEKTVEDLLPCSDEKDCYSKRRALLKYYVRLAATGNKNLTITDELCKDIFNRAFPTPMEQIDYLIRFLGNSTWFGKGFVVREEKPEWNDEGPDFWLGKRSIKEICEDKEPPSSRGGEAYEFFHYLKNGIETSMRTLISATASLYKDNLFEILKNAKELKLIEIRHRVENCYKIVLTLGGWQKYEELKRCESDSKIAFMAMQFNNEKTKDLRDNHLKPFIESLGFKLSILPEIVSKENLIDNKLRVAIRDSRFSIYDLTDRNNGAYWEAGYAEGLGKAVIYVCEKDSFEDKKTKPLHFDVSHQEIYTWKSGDEESIEKFKSDILAKIKISLNV
ncbi:MAG: hypothetical protein LBT18_04810 [Endomicrobium sp.]|jgi:hypothetical protein|nr:hypothetical protein [Endomicrobium sp.]